MAAEADAVPPVGAPNPAGVAFWLDELGQHVRDGLDAIREAKRFGASPAMIIDAVCAGAEQDPSSIPMLARAAITRAIAKV